MSDTDWRLSGSPGGGGVIASRIEGQQVMTQGLGFPLRPVDGAPLQDTGDTFNEVTAEGIFMNYVGAYRPGVYHAKGSVLVGNGFQVIAKRLSLDYPYPRPTDVPTFALPAFAPATQSNGSVVCSGHVYTFNTAVWVKSLRIWVTELTSDTNYRIVITDITDPLNPVVQVIDDPVLALDNWMVVAQLNLLLEQGSVLRIAIDSLNSGADTVVAGGWTYQGVDNSLPPAAQSCNRSQQQTVFRVDKTDLDATDRSTELGGVTPGSTLTAVDTGNPTNSFQYRVVTTTDIGSAFEYEVILENAGNEPTINSPVTLTFTIPVPLPTQYAEEVAGVGTPSWATIEAFLEYNGVPQGGVITNAYGVDIEVQPSDISNDFDILSATG